MFRTNDVNNKQMTFSSSFYWMSDQHRKRLEESWAGTFREQILKNIDEMPYSVLYSTEYSRPNVPVNLLVSIMIIEALFNIPESRISDSLLFDLQVQYALGIENMDNVDVSIRTLERFRSACIEYEAETGIDLIHNTITELARKQAEALGIMDGKFRMDSLMVDSYIRKMSRLELVFQVSQNLVLAIAGISKSSARRDYKTDCSKDPLFSKKAEACGIPVELAHYLNPYDKNLVIYRNNSEKLTAKKEKVLADAMILHKLCGDKYSDLKEFQLFERVLREQCRMVWEPDENDVATIRKYVFLESGEGMDSNICQNPSDPDATYRKKAGKEYRGYVANVIEQSEEKGTSIIREYEYDKNNVSDNDLGAKTIENLGPQEGETPVPVIVDGAFCGEKIENAAKKNNFEIIHTNLNGNKVPDFYADCELNEDGIHVNKCPNGQIPFSCTTDNRGIIHAVMNPEICKGCPYYKDCNLKLKGDKAEFKVSPRQVRIAVEQLFKEDGKLAEYMNFRNGVETIPSLMRRRYHVDVMPVRGWARSKLRFGFIVGAVNFIKCLKGLSLPRVKCA